jgi:transaldolase
MDIYLDTANIEHIRHAARLGVISGVTTNPTLVSRENAVDLKAAVLEICAIVPGPISVEALSLDAEGMKREARELSSWHENIVVKIPVSEAGLEAISVLSQENIKTNLTLCFSANQALLWDGSMISVIREWLWFPMRWRYSINMISTPR